MADLTLSPEVAEVLRRSKITADRVVLPEGQLPRDIYSSVDKALRLAGGKWNRSARAHVFSRDPREVLASALGGGKIEDRKKKLQAFFTPPEIARVVIQQAAVFGRTVLEPSAGFGALADVAGEEGADDVFCIDIDPEAVSVLRSKGHDAICHDFLKWDDSRRFDRIVMNPPFTRGADVKHILHALDLLAWDGVLVSVIAGDEDREDVRELLGGWDWQVIHLEAGAFKASGTNIKTSIITVQRRAL